MLLDSTGARFVDELQKRDVVTAHMVRRGTELAGGREPKQPAFHLVLGAAAAEVAHKHVTMYSRKGLLHRHESISELAEALKVPVSVLQHTLHGYDQQAASGGADQFGKQHFHNTPVSQGPFYTGMVTPALHYSMGGLAVDHAARVLSQGGQPIAGLYAAGEVVGGIHGQNRLGGNAMTECVVFGIIAARSVQAQLTPADSTVQPQPEPMAPTPAPEQPAVLEPISAERLALHNGRDGAKLWSAIHGKVYDLSEFASEHPAGEGPILEAAGRDATSLFAEVHSLEMLEDFTPVGTYNSA